jgi:hypothetical protein
VSDGALNDLWRAISLEYPGLRMTNVFQVSQAIHVAATFGIADLLEDSPRSEDDLAEILRTHGPTLDRLLRALSNVSVLTETDATLA